MHDSALSTITRPPGRSSPMPTKSSRSSATLARPDRVNDRRRESRRGEYTATPTRIRVALIQPTEPKIVVLRPSLVIGGVALRVFRTLPELKRIGGCLLNDAGVSSAVVDRATETENAARTTRIAVNRRTGRTRLSMGDALLARDRLGVASSLPAPNTPAFDSPASDAIRRLSKPIETPTHRCKSVAPVGGP